MRALHVTKTRALLAVPAAAPSFHATRAHGSKPECPDPASPFRALHGSDDWRVVLTFVTVGDSREEAGAPYLNARDVTRLQNTKVWTRIMNEARGATGRSSCSSTAT